MQSELAIQTARPLSTKVKVYHTSKRKRRLQSIPNQDSSTVVMLPACYHNCTSRNSRVSTTSLTRIRIAFSYLQIQMRIRAHLYRQTLLAMIFWGHSSLRLKPQCLFLGCRLCFKHRKVFLSNMQVSLTHAFLYASDMFRSTIIFDGSYTLDDLSIFYF